MTGGLNKIWILSALVFPAAGCATGSGGAMEQIETRPAIDSDSLDTAERERLERLYWSRIDQTRERYTDADVRFMHQMIPHHAQALAMVRIARASTRNESILLLSGRIESSQRDEIALMERWLRARGEDPPVWTVEEDRLVLDEDHHAGQLRMAPPEVAGVHGSMPGMLSDDQMEQLRGAEGARFDRLFLEYMIQHHRGAVTMVHELLDADGAAQDPQVFRLASDVQVDQLSEIARMERMLAALPERP